MSGWSSEAGNPNIQDLKGEREGAAERGKPPERRGGGGEVKEALRFKTEE